jgi:hypothetical protein
MRKIFVMLLGASLLCLASGCGGGSNKVERPANPAPVRKDAKLAPAGAAAGRAMPGPHSPAPTAGQK